MRDSSRKVSQGNSNEGVAGFEVKPFDGVIRLSCIRTFDPGKHESYFNKRCRAMKLMLRVVKGINPPAIPLAKRCCKTSLLVIN